MDKQSGESKETDVMGEGRTNWQLTVLIIYCQNY